MKQRNRPFLLIIFCYLDHYMKSTEILLLLLLLHSALSIDQAKSLPSPKLAVYAGLGFNLAQANPLSNTIDTGFKQNIFKTTYNKNRSTKDRHYLIPDIGISKSASSCSLSSASSVFRGTLSYTNALKKKAEYSSNKLSSFDSNAFTLSIQYDKLQDLTIKQRKTVIHASAQCQAYRITLDTFRRQHFEEKFINSVKSSYKKNDWADFIEFYGTHYVDQVLMGGRMLQEVVFSLQSLSKLAFLKIDLEKIAKLRFAKLAGDKSQDWTRYQTEIKYFENLMNDHSEIILGEKAPKDGNISAWSKSVAEKPMPIGYKLVEITDLFDKIEEVQISLKLHQVKESFVQSLAKYCKKMGCKVPIADFPASQPVKVKLFKSGAVGQFQGQKFSFALKNPIAKLVKVICYSGNSVIDRIQLMFDDGVKKTYSPFFGNLGRGTLQEWTVPQNEYITQFEATFDKISLTGFGFVTNMGTKSPYFGKESGTYALRNIPQGYRIVGIYGQKVHFISNIGFVLAKNELASISANKPTKKAGERINKI